MKDKHKIFWDDIEWVLLDLDGTLLDKYFDDYFWEVLVPEKYAQKYGLSFQEAKEKVIALYQREEGTLNWTDLNFWSKKLGLDLSALKEQIAYLIDTHPYVVDFLKFLKQMGKKVFLVTNAHYKSLSLKLKHTQLGLYFDEVICAFDIGLSKEDKKFWRRLKEKLKLDPLHTLFIDDSEAPLLAAKEMGIKYLFFKSQASSKSPPRVPINNFSKIQYFKELIERLDK